VFALTPDNEKFALATPPATVPDVAVPIGVPPFLIVKTTFPPLADGLTVAFSVTDVSPKVAVAFDAVVVVLTAAELTISVSVFEAVAPGPWHPTPEFVPVT
jgi:hypothetical protein